MPFEIGVDVFDHCRKRGGFAGPGRAGYQDMPRGDSAMFRISSSSPTPRILVQPSLRSAWPGTSGPFAEKGWCENVRCLGQSRRNQSRVRVPVGFQVRRGDVLHNLVHPLLGGRRTLDGKELAINAKDHRRADFQMHVRGPAATASFKIL